MGIKVTRRLLGNYRKTKREIPLLEAELEEMEDTDAGLGSSVILDYREGFPKPQAVVGFDWERYESRQAAFERKMEEVKAVEEWINAIEDGQTRCVFRMFYINGVGWEKIAQKMGYDGNEDYPRICIRDAYLKKIGL